MNGWEILGWFVIVFGLGFIFVVTVNSVFVWHGAILISLFGGIVLTSLDIENEAKQAQSQEKGKCYHKWALIDKWLNKDETISYEFFCEGCLQIEIINHSWKDKKKSKAEEKIA